MTSTVRIPWTAKPNQIGYWDEVCSQTIKMFGRPGDRFDSYANADYMDFVFKSNKDALLMALKWNAEIVPEEQLTIETVSKYF